MSPDDDPEIPANVLYAIGFGMKSAAKFFGLLQSNGVTLLADIFNREVVCLLCSEPTVQCCHRRLAAEMILAAHPGMEVRHL